ncbi:hypothetical protein CEXT_2881 [Caerostris extrusa]|uniref:Uncharacterized protein n=1 Tax=Caerostris extrusa TaxID=172846 RepID=A0AAV4M905_CAEEX|nr:hypothetical protein CEXT_2881 [Caerostris extrusa]
MKGVDKNQEGGSSVIDAPSNRQHDWLGRRRIAVRFQKSTCISKDIYEPTNHIDYHDIKKNYNFINHHHVKCKVDDHSSKSPSSPASPDSRDPVDHPPTVVSSTKVPPMGLLPKRPNLDSQHSRLYLLDIKYQVYQD